MQVKDIFERKNSSFSFEFFPPKTEEGWEKLFESIAELVPLKPAYVSVTYGAGGSTRDYTHDLVVRIQKETDLTVVSHLTCVGHTRDEIYKILERYSENDVENILKCGAGTFAFSQSDFGRPIRSSFLLGQLNAVLFVLNGDTS